MTNADPSPTQSSHPDSPARAFDGSAVPLIVVDQEYRVRGMNPAAEAFYGSSENEAMGRQPNELFVLSYLDDTVAADVVGALRTNGVWRGRLLHTLRDGSPHLMDASLLRVLDTAGSELVYGFLNPVIGPEVRRDGAGAVTPEARFRRMFDHLPEAMLIVDPSGLVLEANGAASALYGYSRLAMVGGPVSRLTTGMDEVEMNRRLELLQDRGSLELVSTGRRADGSTFPQQEIASSVPLAGRTVACVLVRDLSERHQLEGQLARLSDLARLHETQGTVDEIADGALELARQTLGAPKGVLCAFTPDGDVQWLATHGMEEFVAAAAGTRPADLPWLERCLRSGEPTLIDRRSPSIRPDALSGIADRMGISTFAAVPIRAGHHLTGVLGLVWTDDPPPLARDTDLLTLMGRLTGMALANVQLRDTLIARQRALDESDERNRALFDEGPEPLLLQDSGGRIIDANRAAATLFSRERDDLVGRAVEEHVLLEMPERQRMEDTLAREGRGIFRGAGVRSDGSRFPQETYIAAATILGQQSLLVQVRDMTDQERYQGELLAAQKMEALGQLVSGVAHELNNPLSAIMAFSELLRRDERLPEDVHRDARLVHQEADRTRRIVQNLLEFARQRPPTRRPTSVAELVERTLDLQSYAFGPGRITPVLEIPADLPPIDVDPGQVQQVLLNLTLNAIQAIRGTQTTGSITVSACRAAPSEQAGNGSDPDGGVVRITVGDDGPGIPPGMQGRLFEPFFTTKEVGQGTGLGLSVSYGIVTSHRGRLWYEPREGGGSTFVMELPVAGSSPEAFETSTPGAPGGTTTPIPPAGSSATPVAVAPTSSSAEAPTPPATSDTPPATSETTGGPATSILAVDDEPAIRTMLRKGLERVGYTVRVADSGQAALSVLDEGWPVDVLLLDHRMSGMDGVDCYHGAVGRRPGLRRRTVLMSGD
ncbi:MAG: PAS domain S-box protein, partial [Chloroflexi bacterium]|nr:PAS domain S-box protein [Chloroflexota bacterium]